MDRFALQIRFPSGAVVRTWLYWCRPAPDPRQGDVVWFDPLDMAVTVIVYDRDTHLIIACPTKHVAQA